MVRLALGASALVLVACTGSVGGNVPAPGNDASDSDVLPSDSDGGDETPGDSDPLDTDSDPPTPDPDPPPAGVLTFYGTSRLVDDYDGPCLRLHRADGAEQDIGFSGDVLDVAAAASFTANELPRVVVIYAQDGSASHLTASADTAPRLLLGEGAPVVMFRQDEVMQWPSALGVKTNDFAAFFAGRLTAQFRPTPLIELDDDSGAIAFSWFQTYNAFRPQVIVNGSAAATASTMSLMGTASPLVFGINMSGTDTVFIRDDRSEAHAPVEGTSLSHGRLLGSRLPYTYGRADLMSFALAHRALTVDEATSVTTVLRNANQTLDGPAQRAVFIQGDSITEGVGAAYNVTLGRALSDAFADRKVLVRTFGKSGDRMQDSYATFVGAPQGSFLEPNAANVLVTWLGTNDLATGRTLAQLQADIRNYMAGARTQGWSKIVYATALPRADLSVSAEADRVAFNVWLKTDPEHLFDMIWDADGLTVQGGPLAGFTTDGALSPDHLHPSDAAYQLMAPSLKALLDTLVPSP